VRYYIQEKMHCILTKSRAYLLHSPTMSKAKSGARSERRGRASGRASGRDVVSYGTRQPDGEERSDQLKVVFFKRD